MNVAFIIPTGIGCAIGGHAGDATPAAKMTAVTCARLDLLRAITSEQMNMMNVTDIAGKTGRNFSIFPFK